METTLWHYHPGNPSVWANRRTLAGQSQDAYRHMLVSFAALFCGEGLNSFTPTAQACSIGVTHLKYDIMRNKYMRVAHIAFLYGLNNTGGACMAATRLHLALLQHGVDSHFICLQQKESGPNIHELPTRGLLRAIQYIITRIVWVCGYLTPERRIIMPNVVPLLTLERTLRKINPDVVHIHWYMMDTISFSQLAELPYPVIMTLHDLFDVNVEEPYPALDRRFIDGVSQENATCYERWLFARKSAAMKKQHPFMIGPSRWICDTAKRSIIGKDLTFRVVGNVFDNAFSCVTTSYKPQRKFRILFGANGGRANPKKGWDDLMETLPFVNPDTKQNIEIVVFGEAGVSYVEHGVSIRFIGSLTNTAQLKNAYNDAELMALPSKEDNAPNVKFEAWLCGLPVIAFDRTGCAEYIDGENGWVAADGDYEAFAKGIERFYGLFRQEDYNIMRKRIADSSSTRFGETAVIAEISRAYAEAVKQ